jgi:hypothetical protein
MGADSLTKQQAAFLAAYEAGTEGMEFFSTGLCPGCAQCASNYSMDADEFAAAWDAGKIEGETHFSWQPCEVCGSTLGGDREPGHYRDRNDKICHLDGVCVDCIVYTANGDLPPDSVLFED